VKKLYYIWNEWKDNGVNMQEAFDHHTVYDHPDYKKELRLMMIEKFGDAWEIVQC